ncbi:MAG: DNA adenine methylase [Dehalococcoidia bacterium]|nr:DNA adenine methylase [Dehalococcoidia bacterium]
MTTSAPRAARPFLKWAGGKTQLLDALVARSPRPAGATYFEPFLGGGALFFALIADPERRPRRAVLNDLNRELITVFEAVRDDPERLAQRLEPLQRRYLAADDAGRAELYYATREQQPRDPLAVAVRLIFLNKTCYNGLYRVNRSGRFNVPHGRYRNPRILDCEALTAASLALRDAELRCEDFEQACAGACAGDFVYCDPPFLPVVAGFTSYTQADFGRDDQLRLKWCIDDLTRRGVRVMLSDSPHDFVQGMYEGSRYRLERLPARRMINSRGDRRGAVDELVVTNYDPASYAVALAPASSAKSSAK